MTLINCKWLVFNPLNLGTLGHFQVDGRQRHDFLMKGWTSDILRKFARQWNGERGTVRHDLYRRVSDVANQPAWNHIAGFSLEAREGKPALAFTRLPADEERWLSRGLINDPSEARPATLGPHVSSRARMGQGALFWEEMLSAPDHRLAVKR